MDYFDTLNSSKEAELAYAHWYSQQPIEKRAKMMCSFYEFPFKKVKYDMEKENPFVTQALIKSKVIEYTQKEEYSEETFAFIQEKMRERSEKEWQDRFKTMKKDLGWSYEQMALYMEAKNGASVKASINRKLPAFAKLAVCVFEEMNQRKEQDQSKND